MCPNDPCWGLLLSHLYREVIDPSSPSMPKSSWLRFAALGRFVITLAWLDSSHDLTQWKLSWLDSSQVKFVLDSSLVSWVNSSDTRMKYQIVKSGSFWAIFAILVHQKLKKIATSSKSIYLNLPYLVDNATVLRITQTSTVKPVVPHSGSNFQMCCEIFKHSLSFFHPIVIYV